MRLAFISIWLVAIRFCMVVDLNGKDRAISKIYWMRKATYTKWKMPIS